MCKWWFCTEGRVECRPFLISIRGVCTRRRFDPGTARAVPSFECGGSRCESSCEGGEGHAFPSRRSCSTAPLRRGSVLSRWQCSAASRYGSSNGHGEWSPVSRQAHLGGWCFAPRWALSAQATYPDWRSARTEAVHPSPPDGSRARCCSPRCSRCCRGRRDDQWTSLGAKATPFPLLTPFLRAWSNLLRGTRRYVAGRPTTLSGHPS